MLCVYKAGFILVAAVISLLRGWYAVTILVTGGIKQTPLTERAGVQGQKEYLPGKWHFNHHWSWWAHEIFINLLGSAIGWGGAGYYLIFHRRNIDSVTDGFLLLVAMAGVFGFLPFLLFKSTLK